ncbi:type II toxin-antitoxin system RelE/ParE family toxin [Novosphingobium sp.]|uniref:type II toxin-antitoxin system RelE/ParE family toxin n=1 Tax=Novosphingobium sp. TaxID=1874826 RepID=UPI003BAA9798
MRRVTYNDEATDDLRLIIHYITRESGDRKIGAAFVAKLRAKCGKLARLDATLGTARPELGAEVRSTPAEGYVIFFRYLESTVEIINILHGSRDITTHFDPH